MQYAYSVSNSEELAAYTGFVKKHEQRIKEYVDHITQAYSVVDLPEYLVLSNFDMATKVHGSIIIPAYTNEIRIVITPEVAVWKKIYLKQVENYRNDARVQLIKDYYGQSIDDDVVLQILGHELAHQSELFIDDTLLDALWFEEGMAEFISRKFFLTDAAFEQEKRANQMLVELFEEQHSTGSIENFGQSTYDGSYASIFYEYWRSFLLVDKLVHKLGSVESVFEAYHKWHKHGNNYSLSEWFERM